MDQHEEIVRYHSLMLRILTRKRSNTSKYLELRVDESGLRARHIGLPRPSSESNPPPKTNSKSLASVDLNRLT